jgi:hypothetical protein
MSIASAEAILSRIKTATPFSPIAVFKLTEEEDIVIEAESINTQKPIRGRLNAVFAKSAKTVDRIINNDPLFVGIYDRRDSISLVRQQLERIESRRK